MPKKENNQEYLKLVRLLEQDQTAEATQQLDRILANKVLDTVEQTKRRVAGKMIAQAKF